ncbi:tetratricopeptide repeat protein [Pseudostreptobacillus hongkongensis]|uniref:tetratricopeptide repeat protein n=1 Tax=Pseudostreptobacillus hongkongensis TaxID=1162717 RepID=UPI0028D6C37D|nr:tetratricopeptide repeat protein [Pseudostreptobacillus hongkongensis]
MRKLFISFLLLLSFNIYASIETDFKKAIKYISENKLEKAQVELENIVKKKPVNIYEKNIIDKSNYNLALIYNANGNDEKAKKYFSYVSSNADSRTGEAINSNQKLLNYAMNSGNYKEAIIQAEILNKRTMYLELPFLADLIYLYEVNNYTKELEKININVVSSLQEKEKGKLYNLIANIYLNLDKFDDAKRYFNKLISSNYNENKQLGYIGLANIAYLNKDEKTSLLNAEKALNISKKNTAILEQIQIIFANNSNYEKSYEVLKDRLKLEKNPSILVEALRYADYLSMIYDEDMYIKELEKLTNSNYDLGLTFMVYKVYDMAEKYLLKAIDDGESKAYDKLLTLYFGTKSTSKIIGLVDLMVKNKVIDSNKRETLIKEYDQYIEYTKMKE